MNSALASLTAQYTDSENEDDQKDDSDDSQHSQASQVIIPKPVARKEQREEKERSGEPVGKKKKRSKKVRRLVSYQDDTIISDEEPESVSSESSTESDSDDDSSRGDNDGSRSSHSNLNASSNAKHDNNSPRMDVEANSTDNQKLREEDFAAKYAHYGFHLPPEPKGNPPAELVEKINNLYDKMKSSKMDMNRLIQDRKDFRNPSIYEKLIHFCDINEFGTNYPPEMYDPLQWGAESYYEELAKVQKNEMVKRQKERKDTDKIEQATALARKVEEEAKRRKSKWDQPAPSKTTSLPPALTTTVTGTKGTVISAFGTLPKKPV